MASSEELTRKIAKLEDDHTAYVKFCAGCLIGIIGIPMTMEHSHDYTLIFPLIILIVSFIAATVIALKKELQKDQFIMELETLQSNKPFQGA